MSLRSSEAELDGGGGVKTPPPSTPWKIQSTSTARVKVWPQAVGELVKLKPQTLEQLKDIAGNFACSIDGEQLRRMARHNRRRAELCSEKEGVQFEHLL